MITLKEEGLKEAMEMVKLIEELGSAIGGVELNAKERQDTDADNAQILQWLKASGRDFVSPSDEMIEEIGETLIEKLEEGIKQYGGKGKVKASKSKASAIAAKAFIAAMEEVKRIITERIEMGKDAYDGDVKDLSEEYAAYKERTFGFIYPIGKATGQLLDNLAPGVRNIKLLKS